MTYHSPRSYPTTAAQVKRLRWMLKQCNFYGWVHLAALIEKQIKALDNVS